MMNTITQYLTEQIRDNSVVGIVEFQVSSNRLANMTQVINSSERERLIGSLPSFKNRSHPYRAPSAGIQTCQTVSGKAECLPTACLPSHWVYVKYRISALTYVLLRIY